MFRYAFISDEHWSTGAFCPQVPDFLEPGMPPSVPSMHCHAFPSWLARWAFLLTSLEHRRANL